jgi:hypothetical protein
VAQNQSTLDQNKEISKQITAVELLNDYQTSPWKNIYLRHRMKKWSVYINYFIVIWLRRKKPHIFNMYSLMSCVHLWDHHHPNHPNVSFCLSYSYPFSFMVQIPNIRSTPRKSEVYNTVLLALGTMLYSRSPEFILHHWNCVRFVPHIPISPSLLAPAKHHLTLCFHEFDYFRFHM